MFNQMAQPDAVCYMSGGERYPNLKATVKFYQLPQVVLVDVVATGLPGENAGGFFGFHIHEGGSCTPEDFSDTLGHYNPKGTPHPEHAGDMPPLLSRKGDANMAFLTDRFSVADILGKTVVIHSKSDDFMTQPAGNAGQKIACGVITK